MRTTLARLVESGGPRSGPYPTLPRGIAAGRCCADPPRPGGFSSRHNLRQRRMPAGGPSCRIGLLGSGGLGRAAGSACRARRAELPAPFNSRGVS